MSKIILTYDTKAKKSIVTIDGQLVDNLESVSLYRYEFESNGKKEEESHIEVVTREISDDMVKKTITYASQQKENALSIEQLESYANSKVEDIRKATSNWLSQF